MAVKVKLIEKPGSDYFIRCKRCGKILRKTKYKRIGLGPICAAKLEKQKEIKLF